MKKLLFVLMIAVMGFCFAQASFAQTAAAPATSAPKHKHPGKDVMHGTVVSLDATKGELVVKSAKTQKEKTITVTAEQVKEVKVGDTVKVTMPTGKTVAEMVTVVPAAKEAPKAAPKAVTPAAK